MKKTNTSVTKITVFFIFLLVLVVGYYAYLSGTHRTEQQEAKKNPTSSVCREKCRIIKTIREK